MNDRFDDFRQQYSVARHPSLPIFLCTDGYLVSIFKIQTAFSTEVRLIKELVNQTIGFLNSEPKDMFGTDRSINQKPCDNKNSLFDLLSRKVSFGSTDNEKIPEWSLCSSNQNDSDKSSENEVKEKKYYAENIHKIADGKIIFSFIPEIVPLSKKTLDANLLESKLEQSYEYLQSSWSLLISMDISNIAKYSNDYDQIAKAIQQAFIEFSYLFLSVNSQELKKLKVYKNNFNKIYSKRIEKENRNEEKSKLESCFEEEFKVKVLVDLLIGMLKLVSFDPTLKRNPSYHILLYVTRFVEKYIQSLLKYDTLLINEMHLTNSRMSMFTLIYCLLNYFENLMKSIYKLEENSTLFFVNFLNSNKNQNGKQLYLGKLENQAKDKSFKTESDTIETDSLDRLKENKNLILVKSKRKEYCDFINSKFEKCWKNLLHHAYKYRITIVNLGTIREKQLQNLNIFILILERRLERYFNSINKKNIKGKYIPIHKKSTIFLLNEADSIYINKNNLNLALEEWIITLNDVFKN